MYVTVTRDPTNRLVVHGPHYDATTAPDDSTVTVTVAVCPPGAVDRTTGTLSHPYQYAAAGPALAAVPVRAPQTGTVRDLNASTVAVCVHPVSHRMLVVGPFTGPDRAEQWWHALINRLAESGAHCHIVPLTARPSSGARQVTEEGDHQ